MLSVDLAAFPVLVDEPLQLLVRPFTLAVLRRKRHRRVSAIPFADRAPEPFIHTAVDVFERQASLHFFVFVLHEHTALHWFVIRCTFGVRADLDCVVDVAPGLLVNFLTDHDACRLVDLVHAVHDVLPDCRVQPPVVAAGVGDLHPGLPELADRVPHGLGIRADAGGRRQNCLVDCVYVPLPQRCRVRVVGEVSCRLLPHGLRELLQLLPGVWSDRVRFFGEIRCKTRVVLRLGQCELVYLRDRRITHTDCEPQPFGDLAEVCVHFAHCHEPVHAGRRQLTDALDLRGDLPDVQRVHDTELLHNGLYGFF